MTSLGKDAGIGVTASNVVGGDRPINVVSVKMVPIQPKRAYIVSDSTLKLKLKKARAGSQGPDIARVERLQTTESNM